MVRKLLKLSLVCATGAFIFTANPKTAMAFEEGVAGYIYDKDYSSADNLDFSGIPIPGFKNIGIADVETNLQIRKEPGADKQILGKLPKNGGCEILEASTNGWTKIVAKSSTGNITGYVKSEYLITGARANELARQVGNYVATAKVNGLNVREKPSVNSAPIDQIAKGEELIVLDASVITDDKEHSEWVKVSIDSDDSEEGFVAYVAKEYVDLSFELVHALSMQELQYGKDVSKTRVDLVNKAKEYLGNRYVWGGTSLTNGVDCSGFTQQIFKKFGIYLDRVSRDQARGGTKISSSDLKPGDLVFYGSSSYINHVAIYIGNGKVIHASNKRDGIKISNMKYRTPVKYVRYIYD